MRSTILLGVGLAGVIGWVAIGAQSGERSPNLEGFSCSVASITDGDTLRCQDGTRVRLAGINAREPDGSCRGSAPCPAASSAAATSELRRLASGQVLQCRANGTSYDRITAFCSTPGGVDLSCALVSSGLVVVWPRYWRDHRC